MPAKPKKKKHVAKSLSPAREEPQDSEEETVPPPPRGAQQQQPPASARGRGRGRGTRSRGDSQQKKQHADTETQEEQTRKTRETEEETDQQETVSGGAVDKQKRTKADPAFMTREQEVNFADWLKENPHHYDMSNVEFRLKERKAREWEEKATQYNLTSQQLRTRFKTLWDIVNKDKRKGKSGDGAKSLSKRNQFVVETFGFLSQYSHERPSRDTLRVAHVPAEGPRGDDRSSENTDEEERGDEGAENSDATEARAQGPKKRTWKKKKPKQTEQHQELMETLQRAMEENTAVKTQVQQAIDGAGAGTSVDPERAMFGQWFVTALPKIDDEFWLEFRAKINATVQMYQERTSMLRKRGGWSAGATATAGVPVSAHRAGHSTTVPSAAGQRGTAAAGAAAASDLHTYADGSISERQVYAGVDGGIPDAGTGRRLPGPPDHLRDTAARSSGRPSWEHSHSDVERLHQPPTEPNATSPHFDTHADFPVFFGNRRGHSERSGHRGHSPYSTVAALHSSHQMCPPV